MQPLITFDVRETTADLAGYFDNWLDLLVARTRELATLKELASAMDAPTVVHLLAAASHFCDLFNLVCVSLIS
ncbi:hypothetical protein [Rhizobium sp. L9]|uniref:hypothetical protein n=1 Tax=Rhizobium sp. L9 TaxID=1340738 RepID=UPI001596E592|nr:hypothetical protein [Rhizobium sp. L9]